MINFKFFEDYLPKQKIIDDMEIEVYLVGEEDVRSDGDILYSCVGLGSQQFMEATYKSDENYYKSIGCIDTDGFSILLRRNMTFRFYDIKEAEYFCYQQNKKQYKIKGQNEPKVSNFKVIKKILYLKFDSELIQGDYENHKNSYTLTNYSSLIILYKLIKLIRNNKNDRNTYDLIIWRKNVFERDNYTCQCCGSESDKINAHHKDGFAWCIERRSDINNGATLCEKCHKDFHKVYGKGKNTEQQYEEFIKNNNKTK